MMIFVSRVMIRFVTFSESWFSVPSIAGWSGCALLRAVLPAFIGTVTGGRYLRECASSRSVSEMDDDDADAEDDDLVLRMELCRIGSGSFRIVSFSLHSSSMFASNASRVIVRLPNAFFGPTHITIAKCQDVILREKANIMVS